MHIVYLHPLSSYRIADYIEFIPGLCLAGHSVCWMHAVGYIEKSDFSLVKHSIHDQYTSSSQKAHPCYIVLCNRDMNSDKKAPTNFA